MTDHNPTVHVSQVRQKIAHHCGIMSAFLLPLELPITQAAHGLLSPTLGPIYIFAHPLTLVFISVVASRPTALTRHERALAIFVAVCAISTIISSLALHSDVVLMMRFIYFGLCSIVTAALGMRNFESGTPFVRSFFFGVFAWALALMVCYAIYFQTTQVYSFRLPERLLALRAPGSSVANESIFFDVAGNVNKVANYALLLIPLSALAYWRRLIPAQLHYANVTLLVVILMVTFSRGAFVAAGILAAIVVAAAAIEKWRRGRRVRHLVTLSAILVIPVGLSLSDPFFVDYWRNLDTVTARMEQATGVTETGDGSFPTATLLRLMGYGVGNYGRVEFGDSMRGTHNLFLDIWTNGGAVALAAFASLLAYSAFLGLRRWGQTGSDTSLVGTAGITTLVILGFREYDLAYLYATSMGGILVGIFCGLATALPVNYGKPSCS